MTIYTKNGDNGNSSTIHKKNLTKGALIFEALGSLDELNAVVGEIRSNPLEAMIDKDLHTIQLDIFTISSIIAGAKDLYRSSDLSAKVSSLEDSIDGINSNLKPLQNFIIPAGGTCIAKVHTARAICRRAERSFVRTNLFRKYPEIERFLNRLSDWFFILARYMHHKNGIPEAFCMRRL